MKYLFTVQYRDGSTYEQSPDDKSQTGKGSAYGDVRRDEVLRFSLRGNGHVYTVDLSDGHFEVDGTPFRMHEGAVKSPKLTYCRRHLVGFNAGMQAVAHQVAFRFGWEAEDGKQVVMEID